MDTLQLLSGLKILQVVNTIPQQIEGVFCDSNQVTKNSLFVCIKGTNCDGHDFALHAIKNGATVVVCQKQMDIDVCQIVVEDTHKAISYLASAWHGFPAQKMRVICVVGTNGKTSTATLIYKVLSQTGHKSALISTNGIFIDEKFIENKMTTPDPMELNCLWQKMAESGTKFCVMEMSAHAIDQQKTFGNVVDLAVFTNLSQDHLDYFGNMQKYGYTKQSFFDRQYAKIAVVNSDDKLGQKIIKQNKIPTVSYGITNVADVFAIDVDCNGQSSSFIINLYDEVCVFRYNLSGLFNVYNVLACATACRVFGIKANEIVKALLCVDEIEGRNQTVFLPNGVRVVVDYAHTPDGFANVLPHLKQSTKGKLICVFGCGGNRDKTKRKTMGQIASKFCDFVFITSDNPRFEDPFDIMFQVQEGVSSDHQLVCNRGQAITTALNVAKNGDTVAILGKGHEKYQEINGAKYPFCDMTAVLQHIKNEN
ncbi:MAG: UDP-N-acetylmuramoyl-L-alanyl-D-glutamate--2,6-diaminopimelate ligase [Clostridiales bacterium]|nr:UDP-N-acetylmuramoyl-L-alanyl-D-glutamate--2,6-diaminopimelate ligase [Clostridiales bacterium]